MNENLNLPDPPVQLAVASPSETALPNLKPTERNRVYDLVREAGVDVSDWANYKKSTVPAANPKYCYNWAFEGADRAVLCLWYQEMQEDATSVFQKLNYRAISSNRNWTATQRNRAAAMDHAFQFARNKKLLIRVIVVDGSRRGDDEKQASEVERRMLDPDPWHVAAYDDDGNCRLQRGKLPAPPETFTTAEIITVGAFTEGTKTEVTAQVRERSIRLRDLARAHFAAQSPDGRLHCAACDWAPPLALELSGPIVEIHHGIGISSYPTDGQALTFEEAVKHLAPLCPNCHRILHSKLGGGTFTLEDLRQTNRPNKAKP